MTSPNQTPTEASGKTYDWRPRLNEPVAMERIAENSRSTLEQRAHYAMLAIGMQASVEEAEDIIEALQFCESKHGLNKIQATLPIIVATIGNAVTLMQVSITFIGIQRHLASAGLFVGSLVESLAEIDSSTRRFPLSQYQERINSPRVEFEDCMIGVNIAKRFLKVDEMRPQQGLPYCALSAAFRIKRRAKGMLALENTSRELQQRPTALKDFVAAVETMSEQDKVRLPPEWRMYVREFQSATSASSAPVFGG